jgi:hypothetical protein
VTKFSKIIVVRNCYNKQEKLSLECYPDASWGVNPDGTGRKGIITTLNGTTVGT